MKLPDWDGTSAKREYNGPVEGTAPEEGPDTERAGAARGAGVVFYSVEITRSAGAVWSGISSYDFGSERAFFGVPGGGAAGDFIGIAESGVGETLGTLSLTDGMAHTIVAIVDFNNDRLGLFLDPDGSTDFCSGKGTAILKSRFLSLPPGHDLLDSARAP